MKKYTSVMEDIEGKIDDGTYRPGDQLPSVRAAAEAYGCGIGTITRAYAELESRHAIYAIPQSGYYVVERPGRSPGDKDTNLIDFSSALPDVDVFPYLDFQHCLNKAIDTYKHELFTYGDPKGLEKLRQTLVSHLAEDQVFTDVRRILVTSGASPVLEELARMPFPNGKKTILIEQPSYDLYIKYLEAEGIPVSGIARSAAGMDMNELEQRFKNDSIKFFYTMPRFHNPIGTSFSTQDRRRIADLASKYDVYIVEDDYMADLGLESGFDPIYSYNRTSHVIYVKSFSKIIFPGLRLGAVVLPEKLTYTFYASGRYSGPSLLSQAALEVYMNNGMYARHKSRIGSQYTTRIRMLNEALSRWDHEGIMEISHKGAGIYVQFKLPKTVNLERLIHSLAARGVSVMSGKDFYLSNWLDREKFLRISISRTKPEKIEAGVKAILEEVKKARG
ncbi:PLP-dependent aminotransferase family protein [Paenibacillus paeoniae]|uniref:PLP-dependent aminotransferase family protein n=1 Tax=Paenibacillus paeoniae TaxID=2292705 RepID=A0A371PMZ7_9BACL|nr:PLP-dependent aminotransferase family protein [Paenibacillus paeoniae]REK77580.1 PLP-dependent aminotransferase family protein [Paenibacillus paeoniae]